MKSPQLRRCAELTAIDIDQTEAAAAREHSLVSFRQRDVSGPVRDYENFQQCETRCNCRESLFVDRREDRIEHGKKTRVLLNKVNEDNCIERKWAVADLADQSHDLRSTST